MDLDRRFSGLARLYGVTGARAIRASHVVVVGIGGVGSWAAEALARSGVGHMTLIDLDHVAESNINRQVQATSKTLGMAKVIAMRDRIADINPGCVVTMVDDFLTPENCTLVLPNDADAVLDCCDQVPSKVILAATAMRSKTLFVSVGAAGGKKHAHRVETTDISMATHDPLLAKVRYQLRREHGAARDGKPIGVACVFSTEPVCRPEAQCDTVNDGSLNCHGYGSTVALTATFGMCAAGWVINKISLRTATFR